MKNLFLIFIVLLLLIFIAPFYLVSTSDAAEIFTDLNVKFTRVLDGDTILFSNNGSDFKCRVYGIDTPEKFKGKKLNDDVLRTNIPAKIHQKAGLESTQFALDYFNGNNYNIRDYGTDLYQRHLCIIQDYNEKILKEGYAVVYKHGKYIKDKNFRDALNRAQQEGLDKGLNKEFPELMQKLRE